MEIILSNGKKDVMLRGADGAFEFCELRKTTDRDKNSVMAWTPYAWYSSLESALNRLVDVRVSNANVASVEDLQMELKRIRKELTDIYGANI